ncbi:MAG: protein kinase [Desulfomicrobiaceae bacterium]|nr:protein kinase [Desulfomicrobiaceae bacterium]
MRTIGPYPIVGLLGRGGTAVVYRVLHPRLGFPMALKWLRPRPLLLDLWGEAEVRRRFAAEAELFGRLRHRYLAMVYDVGEHQGWPYLLIEYRCVHLGLVLGEPLAADGPCRTVEPAWALRVARQVLEVLGMLHAQGLVHRDVQPANILLTEDGDVRLIDLGLVLRPGHGELVPPQLQVGTPFYAAPEQEDTPGAVGPAADLYAVGVLVHRMVSGHLPDGPGRMHPHPLFTAPWQQFFATALAVDPRRRFASAGQMDEAVAALEAVWRTQQEAACALETPAQGAQSATVRHVPIRTGVRPRQPFGFLDALGRPQSAPASLTHKDDGLWDAETGLLWQPRVSPWAMTWEDARQFAAEDGWRLPTVEEGARLLGQSHCPMWPALPHVAWLWTADRRSFTSAWCLDVRGGAVTWQDCGPVGCLAHVLGVRGPL